jgi:hypothetical protein
MNVQKLIKSGKSTLAAMHLFGNHGYSIHIGRFMRIRSTTTF